MELLDWIAQHGWASFWIGVFLISTLGTVTSFILGIARSITGNYPPAEVNNYYSGIDETDDEPMAGPGSY